MAGFHLRHQIYEDSFLISDLIKGVADKLLVVSKDKESSNPGSAVDYHVDRRGEDKTGKFIVPVAQESESHNYSI